MTQSELNRAVAQATGEDRETIARRGFSLVDEDASAPDDDLLAHFVDWDELQAHRNTAVLARSGVAAVA